MIYIAQASKSFLFMRPFLMEEKLTNELKYEEKKRQTSKSSFNKKQNKTGLANAKTFVILYF